MIARVKIDGALAWSLSDTASGIETSVDGAIWAHVPASVLVDGAEVTLQAIALDSAEDDDDLAAHAMVEILVALTVRTS